MEVPVQSEMLRLFRSDEPSYQPVSARPLREEDGDPQASLENLRALGLVVQDIWVRENRTRVLLQFSTGEQYLALGLSDPAALAFVAAEAGFGSFEHLKVLYDCLPPSYDGKLPAEDEPRGNAAGRMGT